MLNVVARIVLSLAIVLPLVAQNADQQPAQPAGESPEPQLNEQQPRRELRVIANSATENHVAKFNSDGTAVVDTLSIFEDASGRVGIGTFTPSQQLHLSSNQDAGAIILAENTNATGSGAHAALRTTSALSTTSYFSHGNRDVNTTRFGIQLTGWSEILNATGNGLIAGSLLNTPLVFGTNNSERMRITGSGFVGIGTAAPEQLLHVWKDANASTTIEVRNLDAAGGSSAATFRTDAGLSKTSYVAHGAGRGTFSRYGIALAGWGEILNYSGNGLIIGTNLNVPLVFGTANVERVRILGNGNVGIGTNNPTAKLHIAGDVIATSSATIGPAGGDPATLRMVVNGSTSVVGNIVATGSITGARVIGAVYQDVAEWVPSSDDLAPGTVVILDKRAGNTVTASKKAYDTLVAGVVSEQPGILLGIGSPTKEQIATTGRVRVRVDASKGAIEIGDLLVTSDKPGTAMRSAPLDLGGVAIHRPGTIIGKALEPLSEGVGEILVLLSLQ